MDPSKPRGLPTWAAVLVVVVFILPAIAFGLWSFTTQRGSSYLVYLAPFDALLIYALLRGKLGSRGSRR